MDAAPSFTVGGSVPDVLLYDADCGFCKWAVCKILTWDRRARLRPVPIQEAEGASLLGHMQPERRLDSWHIATASGDVFSGGAALPAVLRQLPGGGPLAWLFARFPGLTDRGYRWVAANRSFFGRFTRRSRARSERCIERRVHALSV
jgi:predicted DCC family thiol-disulfide oxidoreductase YuxK